ncbi:MAG: hypothetical protein ACWGQW_06295 [bacterium]
MLTVCLSIGLKILASGRDDVTMSNLGPMYIVVLFMDFILLGGVIIVLGGVYG